MEAWALAHMPRTHWYVAQVQRRCEELEAAALRDRGRMEGYAHDNLKVTEERDAARRRAREAEHESVTLRDRVAALDKVRAPRGTTAPCS